MAEDNGPTMDYAEHEKTYRMFVSLVTWSTIGSAIVLILMAIFLL